MEITWQGQYPSDRITALKGQEGIHHYVIL